MAIDDINNRPASQAPDRDPELSISSQDSSEKDLEITVELLHSHMEEMLQFNYGVVQELLGQIAAISPYRPDMALGKQPEIAAIDASNSVKGVSVTPVGETSASAYVAGLQYVESMMTGLDLKLQQLFDKLSLSRSGRKPDPENQGLEFERLKSIIIQVEGRMNQVISQLPESMSPLTVRQFREAMPELVDNLRQFDASFREALLEIREEIVREMQKR